MLSLVDPQTIIPPILQRFHGCIVLDSIPPEVREAIDDLEKQHVPKGILFLVKIWRGRDRIEKSLPDVIQLLQDTVNDTFPLAYPFHPTKAFVPLL
jgi:hypothetical protein